MKPWDCTATKTKPDKNKTQLNEIIYPYSPDPLALQQTSLNETIKSLIPHVFIYDDLFFG
jgi:hypothetical protein